MSNLDDLLAHHSEKSITDILQTFDKSDFTEPRSHVLQIFYTLLAVYTRDESNDNLTKLSASFKEVSTGFFQSEIDLSNFDDLYNAIRHKENELKILELSLSSLVENAKFIATLNPSGSNITFTRQYSEIPNSYSTAKDLENVMKVRLDNNVFFQIANFWEFLFENKGWSKQTSRIWDSYQKYENAEKKQRKAELQELEKLKDKQELLHKAKSEKIFEAGMEEKEIWDWLDFFRQIFLDQPSDLSTKPSKKYPIVIEKPCFRIQGQYCRTSVTKQAHNSSHMTQLNFLVKNIDLPQGGPADWNSINVLGDFTIILCGNIRKNKFIQISRSVREIFCAQPLRRYVHGFCLFGEEFELWLFDRSGAYSSGLKKIVDDKEMFIRALSSYLLVSNEELGGDMTILQCREGRFVQFPKIGDSPGPSFEIKPNPTVQPSSLITRGTTCYGTKDEMKMIKYSWSSPKKNTEVDFLNTAKGTQGVVSLIASDVVYETKSHLKNLSISTALCCDLKSEQNFITQGYNTKEQSILSMDKNRRLIGIAMTPCGRLVYSSGSILDFVAGIRDVIKAHEGLVGKEILLGDISEENIILLKPSPADGLYGMFIDFDHSVKLKEGKAIENSRSLIGTVKFMALERLESVYKKNESIRRTCRHDLESFFYVFIVGCIEYEIASPNKAQNLNHWCSNEVRRNFESKEEEVVIFGRLLNKFTTSFKGLEELANKLRQILFHEDGRYIKSPSDCGPLYRKIIDAFDETIEDIKGGRIENKYFRARRG